MIKTELLIKNKLGLHARASAKFVATCLRFQSQVDVIKKEQRINGKSIMAVMMLAASQGSQLDLEINGPDEKELEIALIELVNDYFGEGE